MDPVYQIRQPVREPHRSVKRAPLHSTLTTLFGLALVLTLGACEDHKEAPTASRSGMSEPVPVIDIRDGRGLLFTYIDARGDMRTVARLDQVDFASRESVMVASPQHPPSHDRIYVADLRKPLPNGAFSYRVLPRSMWLRDVMPSASKLSTENPPRTTKINTHTKPVVSTRVTQPKMGRQRTRSRSAKAHTQRKPTRHATSAPKSRPPALAAANNANAITAVEITQPRSPSEQVREITANPSRLRPRIIVFGTSWCPSCRTARQYFQRKGVRFADLDVERDAKAAAQYQQISRAHNLRPGVVPVIVVGERVFQGFSRLQVEAALTRLGT